MIVCSTYQGIFRKCEDTNEIFYYESYDNSRESNICDDYLLPLNRRPKLLMDKFEYTVYAIILDYYILKFGELYFPMHMETKNITLDYTNVNFEFIEDL